MFHKSAHGSAHGENILGISKYKTPRGYTRFRATVTVKKVRKTKVFEKHIEAAVWLDRTERLLHSGKSTDDDIAPGDMLFKEASDRFIIESRATVSPSHIKNYEFAQLQLIRSFGKNTKMSEILPLDASAHVLKRMTVDNVGPSSVRAELSLIRLVYSKAVEWGVSISSPELNIKRPRARMKSREERRDKVIKTDELNAVFLESRKRSNSLYYYLLFLLYTGMRPTEAAHLYWKRLPVAQEKEAIKNRLPVGHVDLSRGGFSKIGTKTDKRFVPAHPEALKIIEHLRVETPKEQNLVFLPNKYINSDRAYRYYRRSMHTTIKNTDIEGVSLRKDITFYSFRHTCRSSMEICQIPTAIAETIIGHNDKSFKFTYIHVSDEDLIREIAKLEFPGLVLF